jgi:hypothetical protein
VVVEVVVMMKAVVEVVALVDIEVLPAKHFLLVRLIQLP